MHPKRAGTELMARVLAKTLLARFAGGAPPVEPIGAPLEYHMPVIPGVSIPYTDHMPGVQLYDEYTKPEEEIRSGQLPRRRPRPRRPPPPQGPHAKGSATFNRIYHWGVRSPPEPRTATPAPGSPRQGGPSAGVPPPAPGTAGRTFRTSPLDSELSSGGTFGGLQGPVSMVWGGGAGVDH